MENASKALIIAAEVLIGVLLLTLMVFAFRAMGSFSDSVDKNIEMKNLSEFNTKFEIYRKNDLTAQDVITIGNLAKKYNRESDSIQVTVNVNGTDSKYENVHRLSDTDTYEFIKKYSANTFECENMEYNKTTGKIQKITLKKVR